MTVDDLREIWPADGRCPALGLQLVHAHDRVQSNSASVDRLDPSGGYERGNIAIISSAANRAKGNMRAIDLERIAAWMRANGLD